jgi:hypothetical protein
MIKPGIFCKKNYSINARSMHFVQLNYLLCVPSEDTVNFFLPFLLREANTLRPFLVAIRLLKPCLFFLFRTDG